MDRCAGGPVAVVYPEGVWYTYVDTSDIDEIVDSHLKRGEVVTRLLLPPNVGRYAGCTRHDTENGARADRRAGRAGSSARSTALPARRAASPSPATRIRSSAAPSTTRSFRRSRAPASSRVGSACASTFAASAPPRGSGDEGLGEVDDALAVVAAWRGRDEFAGLPYLLAGLSFGGYVAAEVAQRLGAGDPPRRMVLVGPSTEKQRVANVPADTLVIHGESDDVVPLAATFDWARPQNLPVIVFPGVGHFFHGQISSAEKSHRARTARPRRGLTTVLPLHRFALSVPMLLSRSSLRHALRRLRARPRRRRRRPGAATARGRGQELHRPRPDHSADACRARGRCPGRPGVVDQADDSLRRLPGAARQETDARAGAPGLQARLVRSGRAAAR